MTTTVLAYFPSPTQGVWYLGPVPIRAYALCIIAGIFDLSIAAVATLVWAIIEAPGKGWTAPARRPPPPRRRDSDDYSSNFESLTRSSQGDDADDDPGHHRGDHRDGQHGAGPVA